VCHRSPTSVAISDANDVIIVFSIVVAAGWNQIKFPSLLLVSFAPPGHISSPFSVFSAPHGSVPPVPPPSSSLSFLLLPGFYLNMLVLVFILVSRHRRSACSCCGFAYVLHMNEFMRSLLTNFYCDSGLLHLFPCNFFYWRSFEPFSLHVLMDLNRLLCWKPSHRFKDFAFLLAGAVFICILGSEVLVFVNGIFFLFKPPGKLQRHWPKHHYGPVWMSVPLVAFKASFMVVMTMFCSLFMDSSRFALLWCVEVFMCVWPFDRVCNWLLFEVPLYKTTTSIIYVIGLFS